MPLSLVTHTAESVCYRPRLYRSASLSCALQKSSSQAHHRNRETCSRMLSLPIKLAEPLSPADLPSFLPFFSSLLSPFATLSPCVKSPATLPSFSRRACVCGRKAPPMHFNAFSSVYVRVLSLFPFLPLLSLSLSFSFFCVASSVRHAHRRERSTRSQLGSPPTPFHLHLLSSDDDDDDAQEEVLQ